MHANLSQIMCRERGGGCKSGTDANANLTRDGSRVVGSAWSRKRSVVNRVVAVRHSFRDRETVGEEVSMLRGISSSLWTGGEERMGAVRSAVGGNWYGVRLWRTGSPVTKTTTTGNVVSITTIAMMVGMARRVFNVQLSFSTKVRAAA